MKKTLFAAVVFCFLLSAGFGVYLRPLLYTLTPLQRHYLGAYLASSWHESAPAATTEIRWIWKFKPDAEPPQKKQPKLQYALAHEDDVLPIPSHDLLWKGDVLPFWMTRKAELDGWAGIEQGLSTQMNSAKLAELLRDGFFEGEPAWRFFVQPVILLVVGCVLLWMLWRWLDEHRERNLWRAQPVPLWREAGQQVLASGVGLRHWLESRSQPLALPAATPARVIEATPDPEPVPKPRPLEPSVAAVQKSPVAAPIAAQPKRQGTFWDESKGIE